MILRPRTALSLLSAISISAVLLVLVLLASFEL
jgi:hypothetical protein